MAAAICMQVQSKKLMFCIPFNIDCRNLSVAGGPEVCEKMVEQDVMTPLSTFVRQVSLYSTYF